MTTPWHQVPTFQELAKFKGPPLQLPKFEYKDVINSFAVSRLIGNIGNLELKEQAAEHLQWRRGVLREAARDFSLPYPMIQRAVEHRIAIGEFPGEGWHPPTRSKQVVTTNLREESDGPSTDELYRTYPGEIHEGNIKKFKKIPSRSMSGYEDLRLKMMGIPGAVSPEQWSTLDLGWRKVLMQHDLDLKRKDYKMQELTLLDKSRDAMGTAIGVARKATHGALVELPKYGFRKVTSFFSTKAGVQEVHEPGRFEREGMYGLRPNPYTTTYGDPGNPFQTDTAPQIDTPSFVEQGASSLLEGPAGFSRSELDFGAFTDAVTQQVGPARADAMYKLAIGLRSTRMFDRALDSDSFRTMYDLLRYGRPFDSNAMTRVDMMYERDLRNIMAIGDRAAMQLMKSAYDALINQWQLVNDPAMIARQASYNAEIQEALSNLMQSHANASYARAAYESLPEPRVPFLNTSGLGSVPVMAAGGVQSYDIGASSAGSRSDQSAADEGAPSRDIWRERVRDTARSMTDTRGRSETRGISGERAVPTERPRMPTDHPSEQARTAMAYTRPSFIPTVSKRPDEAYAEAARAYSMTPEQRERPTMELQTSSRSSSRSNVRLPR